MSNDPQLTSETLARSSAVPAISDTAVSLFGDATEDSISQENGSVKYANPAEQAAFDAGRANVPKESLKFETPEQEIAYNNGKIAGIKNTSENSESDNAKKNNKNSGNTRKKRTPTREVLQDMSKNGETLNISDVKKVTGLGDSGATLITELVNDGMTFYEAEKTVKPMYLAGFKKSSHNNSITVPAKTAVQKRAFIAGQNDRVTHTDSMRSKAKGASIRENGFTENEYSKKLTRAEREMISILAKDLGLSVEIVDKVIANYVTKAEANAEHSDGNIRISDAANKLIHSLVLHEAGHRMEQFATDEWNTLADALYERAERLDRKIELGNTQNLKFDKIKEQHDDAGITKDMGGYFGEVVMNELETIFGSAKEFNRWVSEIKSNRKAKNAFRRLMDCFSSLVGKIKRRLSERGLSKDARARMREEYSELQRIRELYAQAYKATEAAIEQRRMESVKSRKNEESRETSFAIKNVGEDKVVYIDNDITQNKPENMKYTEYIEKYIAEMFEDNDYVSSLPDNGTPIFASDDLPGEFANSKYTKYLRNRKQDRFSAKMRLASSLEELVSIATGRRWEKAIHPDNKDVKYGVYKYSSTFAFPVFDASGETEKVFAYNCDIVVINASNGKKYLYDVLNIKENTELSKSLTEREQKKASFQKKENLKKRDTTTAGGIRKKESAGRQTSQLRSISEDSISQDKAIVNTESEVSGIIAEKSVQNSLKEIKDTSSADTQELLDTIEQLKHEFEITKFAKADPKKLAKLTKGILKDYDSKIDYNSENQTVYGTKTVYH